MSVSSSDAGGKPVRGQCICARACVLALRACFVAAGGVGSAWCDTFMGQSFRNCFLSKQILYAASYLQN